MSVNIYLSFIISSCWIWFWVLRISSTSSSLCWFAAASLNTMWQFNSIPLFFCKNEKVHFTFCEPQINTKLLMFLLWSEWSVWPLTPGPRAAAALPGRRVIPPHGRKRGQRRLQRRRGRHLGGELGEVLRQRRWELTPRHNVATCSAARLLLWRLQIEFQIEFKYIRSWLKFSLNY